MGLLTFIGSLHAKWRIAREEKRIREEFICERFEEFLTDTEPDVPAASKYPEAALYRHAWKRSAVLSVINRRAGYSKTADYYARFAQLAAKRYSRVAPDGPFGRVKLRLSYNAFVRLAENEVDKLTSERLDTSGVVYLLRMDAYYKIGFTNDITRRVGELGILLPRPLELVHYIKTNRCERSEKYWHEFFKSKRQRGEWFCLSSEDVDEFKKHTYMDLS